MLWASWEAMKQLTLEEGMEKGRKEGVQRVRNAEKWPFVKNLLLNTDFNTAKIASLADVSASFVKKVQKELKK